MSPMLVAFLVIVLGYLLGGIKVKGVSIGSSGVLLIALIFGHFGFEFPAALREFGLVCFVAAVGLIAGPSFFRNFKKHALVYVVIGVLTVVVGALTCVGVLLISGMPTALGLGIMTGAMTSTPGLAAALEATGDSMASVGYGIAYPFGVLGVALFVQIVYKLRQNKRPAESTADTPAETPAKPNALPHKLAKLDAAGLFPFALAVAAGILIGSIAIPLPGGAVFSLGNSGGPLVSGLLIGHLGRVGRLSLAVPRESVKVFQEMGLVFFLAGAGVGAGAGFIETLREYGVALFLWGLVMTTVPMLASYLTAVLFRLGTEQALGSFCGGMTSTPALGTLTALSPSEEVITSYAATYPIALTGMVLASQFIGLLM